MRENRRKNRARAVHPLTAPRHGSACTAGTAPIRARRAPARGAASARRGSAHRRPSCEATTKQEVAKSVRWARERSRSQRRLVCLGMPARLSVLPKLGQASCCGCGGASGVPVPSRAPRHRKCGRIRNSYEPAACLSGNSFRAAAASTPRTQTRRRARRRGGRGAGDAPQRRPRTGATHLLSEPAACSGHQQR